MDFASLMSAAISKDKSSAPPEKKYLKRSEVEEQRRAAYLEEQARLEAEKEAKAAAKRKREEDEAEAARERDEKRRKLKEESKKRREEEEREEERKRRKKLGLPDLEELKDGEEGENGSKEDIPDEELRSKLRAMGEPVTLFGESYKARLRRYKRLSVVMTQTVIPTSLDLVEEKDMKVSDQVPAEGDIEGLKWIYRQLASYFTLVLTEWEIALQGTEKETFAGKAAWRAWVDSREHLIPVGISILHLKQQLTSLQLFRRFETNTLDPSILPPMLEIVKAAQERRYVDANDGYLRLSIGKAAWPIGVTMVGIHERSAREKLHESDKGHVMGDEITRKFLQSIKRCLTFAQVKWPPEDARQLMG